MKNHKILWGMIVLLIAAILVEAVSIYTLFGRWRNTTTELIQARQGIDSLKSELEEAHNTINEETAHVADLEAQLQTAQDERSALVEEKASLLDQMASMEAEYQSQIELLDEEKLALQKKLSANTTQITKFETELGKLKCDKSLTMDYSSILASSSRVQSFVDGLPNVDHVSWTYRDSIWTNTDTKIHGVRYIAEEDGEQYVMLFLVYTDEFGMKASTFWIDEQCWLDPP